MLNFLKGLFGVASTAESVATGGWVKYVAILAVAGAALFGAYEYGSSHGYKDGYKTAWDVQQKTLDKLTEERNAETTAQNAKITALEQAASNAMDQVKAAQDALDKQRTQTVSTFKTANPKVAASTAWSPETVNAINQMLGAQK